MSTRHKDTTRFTIPVPLLTTFLFLVFGTLLVLRSGNASDELLWTDRSTKLMWYCHGYRSYRNLYGGTEPASWRAVNEWIRSLNTHRIGGFSDWRLPSAEEYATLFEDEAGAAVYDYRNGREVELYRVGYRPEIKGLKRYAWSGEKQGNRIVCYDFLEDRPTAYDASLDITYEFDALAVRTHR
jgi:hypothetical protein